MPEDGEINVKKEEVPGGIRIEPTEGEIKPPLEQVEGEIPSEEAPEAKRILGKIALSPAVIKPPLRLEGTVLAEATGWKGWLYTEEELNELCELIEQCGIEMKPQVQVLISLGTMHGVRVACYMNWKRMGRPGDTRKQTGEKPKEEKPGEETRI